MAIPSLSLWAISPTPAIRIAHFDFQARTLGSRGFYFPAYLSSLPPRAGDILTVRFRTIDGERTFTSPDSRLCRPLPQHNVFPDNNFPNGSLWGPIKSALRFGLVKRNHSVPPFAKGGLGGICRLGRFASILEISLAHFCKGGVGCVKQISLILIGSSLCHALSGLSFRWAADPGRCPGLVCFALSGRRLQPALSLGELNGCRTRRLQGTLADLNYKQLTHRGLRTETS